MTVEGTELLSLLSVKGVCQVMSEGLNALCKRSRLYRTSAGDLLEELGDYVEGERSYLGLILD